MDVRYCPGALNGAANGLSRQFTAAAKTNENGHLTSVNSDWGAVTGLTPDMFGATDEVEEEHDGGWMCRYTGLKRVAGDGHEWTVGEGEDKLEFPGQIAHQGPDCAVLLAGLD